MSKYIDADRLIHDLEERIYAYSEGYADGDDCRKDAIETLLKDVKYQCSLQQERPGVDFKIEERKWVYDAVDNIFPEDGDFMSEVDFRKIIKATARHFYELGLKEK